MAEKDPIMAALVNDTSSMVKIRCKRSYTRKKRDLIPGRGWRWQEWTYTKGQVLPRSKVKGWKNGHWEIAE